MKRVRGSRPEDQTPSPKRQRSSRASTSGKRMSYDMKYHPMDDVVRPAASAARKAAHGIRIAPPCKSSPRSEPAVGDESNSDSDSEIESESESHPAGPHEPTTPEVSTPRRRPVRPRVGSPSNRRVTRAEVNGEKPVMYSMKHHPADVVLRPAAAKKAIDEWESERSPPIFEPKDRRALPQVVEEDAQNVGLDEMLPALTSWSPAPLCPSSNAGGKGWNCLSESDRMLYSLQKGAPYTTADCLLPMSWIEVAVCLQRHLGPTRTLTVPTRTLTVQAQAPTEALKIRYAFICGYLQGSFRAEAEPATEQTRTMYYAEDFDVYDMERGEKYFRSRKESVVQPVSTLHVIPSMDQEQTTEKDEDETEDEEQECQESYDDEEGYIQQALGPQGEDCEKSSPERDTVAGIRDSISEAIGGMLDTEDLDTFTDILYPFAEPCVSSEEIANDDRLNGLIEDRPASNECQLSTPRSKKRTDRGAFSVHEDQPGSTPKTRKMVSNFKSPGTDILKENMEERNTSEETL